MLNQKIKNLLFRIFAIGVSISLLLVFSDYVNLRYENLHYFTVNRIAIDDKLNISDQFVNIRSYSVNFSDKSGYVFQCKNSNQIQSEFRNFEFRIPLVFRTCKNLFNDKYAPIAIWLHGGPFASSQSLTSPEQDLFLQNGYIIVEVQYIGSAERPWINSLPDFSAKNFLDTRREVIELGRFYKKNGRKITYAGDSFGGKIISSLLDEMDQSDNVVMLSPYLQSVKSDPKFSNAKIAKPSEKWVFQIICRLTAVTECDDPDAWFEKNIFRNYYEFTPIENFRGLKLKPKIYIVSGADDKRVGVEPAKAFTTAFSTSTKHLIIPNLGHESPKNIEQFEEIERFLAPVLNLGSKQ